jgi:type II secretory pathway pseudopilin PulG
LRAHKRRFPFQKTAFTFVELMMVIGVIVVLMSLVAKGLQGSKAAAKRLQCMGNIRSLGVAAIIHADSARGLFPTPGSKILNQKNCFGLLYDPSSFNDMTIFVCPSVSTSKPLPGAILNADTNDKDFGQYQITSNPENISYSFVKAQDGSSMQTMSYPATNILLIERAKDMTAFKDKGVFVEKDHHGLAGGACFHINGKTEFIGKGGEIKLPENKTTVIDGTYSIHNSLTEIE